MQNILFPKTKTRTKLNTIVETKLIFSYTFEPVLIFIIVMFVMVIQGGGAEERGGGIAVAMSPLFTFKDSFL